MTSPNDALAKLEKLKILKDGWQFGEGKAIINYAVGAIGKYINFATKAHVTEMEVFPRLDGGLELNLYSGERTMEIACLPDRTFLIRNESANGGIERIPGLTFKDVLSHILRFTTWSSTASSTLITGTTASSGIIAPPSRSPEQKKRDAVFPSHAKAVPIQKPKPIAKRLVPESIDTTALTPETSTQFFGSWNSEHSEMESAYATASPQQETYAIMTWSDS